MSKFQVSTLLLLFSLILPLPLWAGDAETAYRQADASYRSLRDSAKKQLYRENWHQVIDRFLQFTETYPRAEKAPAALYVAGKACRGLYRVSRVSNDALRAVEIFERLEREYPRSSLADDALLQAGEIEETVLGDLSAAYLFYRRIVDLYPAGDMYDRGLKRSASLISHAPAIPRAKARPEPPAAHSSPQPASASAGGDLTGIRFWSKPGLTRVVIDMEQEVEFTANTLPASPKEGEGPRIFVDIKKSRPAEDLPLKTIVNDGLLRQIRTGRQSGDVVRVVMDLVSYESYKIFPLSDPYRIVIDIDGGKGAVLSKNEPEIRALPASEKDRIARVLEKTPDEKPLAVNLVERGAGYGLRRIVVDAGHGGKDPGAVGPSNVLEKDVTLAMAKVLAKRLEEDLGCEVILTRDRDVYLPLEERTAIANRVGADLFISIHANANESSKAYGVETFYLNFSKNDKAAAVAARENGTSLKQVGDLELILFDLMANSKINESSRLAAEVQKSMVDYLSRSYSKVRDLGVRQGPFYVLVGATMPSVLVEAAFISNKREESRLTNRKYQEKTCAAIAKGVRNYATSMKLVSQK